MSAVLLVSVLRDPAAAPPLSSADWTRLFAAARAERLLGTLAHRLAGLPVPDRVAAILADARFDAATERRQALWEADRARVALAGLPDVRIVLLKGTAYVAAGLAAGTGRSIGDLDILVARDRLDDVEAALLVAGWEWVKPDPYDDIYYRRWMHELPPLIHRDRDRMIDVHHTILPLTARPSPDAAAMIRDAIVLEDGLFILSPEDRLCHAAAHMLADGGLEGGLRNLWDIHCLCAEASETQEDFYPRLFERAAGHGLTVAVWRALRLAHHLYGTPVRSQIGTDFRLRWSDRLFIARLMSRDGWGREGRWLLGQGFYIRSHLLRMPPMMLARHLWTKWRRGYRPLG
ncbi:nucleotidyltransferase family protein [Sphingobium sufflavum]|uniref:nucleotidyltransferase domain-containing protein n=1 Tax=Sphingobium sufflavum TaxID=1129547 RepID=UPI001F39C9D4|nr:nucleotidyltransferase family protein [Sphingobium sufflavum]MCE7795822.1 nucleotidyltransferase family protein [Sphingobium sufflavum]